MKKGAAKQGKRTLDPRDFDTELDQVLAVLVGAVDGEDPSMSSSEIAAILEKRFRIGLHWRRIQSLLDSNRGLASRKRKDKKWRYLALKAAHERFTGGADKITFVDPSKAISATLSLHVFLQSLKGVARICDPYCDPTTLDHLSACPTGVEVRILTKNVKEGGRLRTLLAAAKTEGRVVEIRIAGGAPLHDRYVIDDEKMLILGTSLNGFGKKQGFVVAAGPDIRETVFQAFEVVWAASVQWV